jgi:hypothetical protein
MLAGPVETACKSFVKTCDSLPFPTYAGNALGTCTRFYCQALNLAIFQSDADAI